jgi:hypothetical protein
MNLTSIILFAKLKCISLNLDDGRILTFVYENSYRILDENEAVNNGERSVKLEEYTATSSMISINTKLIHSEEINLFCNQLEEARSFEIKSSKLFSTLKMNHSSQDLKLKIKQKSKRILNVKLYNNKSTNHQRYLIVMTQNKLISLPAQFCNKKTNAYECDNNLYPYCFWSKVESKCQIFKETLVEKEMRYNTNEKSFLNINRSREAHNNTKLVNNSTLGSISYRMIANKLKYLSANDNRSDAESNQNNSSKNITDCDLTTHVSESFVSSNNGDEFIISMSVYLFLLIIFIVLLISFTFGILLTYNIYGKLIASKLRQKIVATKPIERKFENYLNNSESKISVEADLLNSSSCFLIDLISGLNKNRTINTSKIEANSTKGNRYTCKKLKNNKKKATNYLSMSSSISSQPSNVQSHVGFMIGSCSCSSAGLASCTSSSSSESHSPTIAKSTDLIRNNQVDSQRYVYVNNKTKSNLEPIQQQILYTSLLTNPVNLYNDNHKFMDYDQTEYFSLRKSRLNHTIANHNRLVDAVSNAQINNINEIDQFGLVKNSYSIAQDENPNRDKYYL